MHLRTFCGTQPEQYLLNSKLPCFLARQRPRIRDAIFFYFKVEVYGRSSIFCVLGSSGNHRHLLLFICHQDGLSARLSSIFFWRRVISTKAEIFSQDSSLSSITSIIFSSISCPTSISNVDLGAAQQSH